MLSEPDALWIAYEELDNMMRSYESSTLVVYSILLPASLILATLSFDPRIREVAHLMPLFGPATFPLAAAMLALLALLYWITVWRVDTISWKQIHSLECRLGIMEGHGRLRLRDMLRSSLWFRIRHIILPIFFGLVLTSYILLSLRVAFGAGSKSAVLRAVFAPYMNVLFSILGGLIASKGETCLRKVYFGKATRFSMDLDFTAVGIELEAFKDRLRQILHKKEHYGVSFIIGGEFSRREDDVASYGAVIEYAHEWRSSIFEVNVSFREEPCLEVIRLPLVDELYFGYCEFKQFEVPCMRKEELIAEKIRAAFQRLSSRDLYVYTNTPYNKDAVKALTVIKCWNMREAFDSDLFLNKIRSGEYDWSDLMRLVRPDQLPTKKEIVKTVAFSYKYLRELDDRLKRIKANSRAQRYSELVSSLIYKLSSVK